MPLPLVPIVAGALFSAGSAAAVWIGTNVPVVKDITGSIAQGTINWFNKNVTQPSAENAEKTKLVAFGSALNEWGKWIGGLFPGLGNLLQRAGQYAMGENVDTDPRDVAPTTPPTEYAETTTTPAANSDFALAPSLGDTWRQTAFVTNPEPTGLGITFANARLGVTAQMGAGQAIPTPDNRNTAPSLDYSMSA